MKTNNTSAEARHPIGVVTSRTRIPPDVLRAWERRYRAVIPQRSGTGRRLYTDLDIEKLRLLRQAVEAGRRISDVAELSIGDLKTLIEEDVAQTPEPARAAPTAGRRSTQKLLESAMRAVEDLDRESLERVLGDASINLTGPAMRREFIAPLLERIGEGWRKGNLRIANEHLAAAVVRSHLGSLRAAATLDRNAPRLIATTPAGERHELGALMAATAAAELGWDVEYLGPDLPAEEIAAAAQQENVKAVGLSLVYAPQSASINLEMRRLRDLLGPSVPILIGGRSALNYSSTLEEIGAVLIRDLMDLQQVLDDIAS